MNHREQVYIALSNLVPGLGDSSIGKELLNRQTQLIMNIFAEELEACALLGDMMRKTGAVFEANDYFEDLQDGDTIYETL